MEWILFLLGLVPYLIEMYFLRYAYLYKLPEGKESAQRPFVSVQVPIHKEPPKLVMRTLESLKNQDYGLYEVLVLVNNTPYEIQKPIEDYCKRENGVLRYNYLWTRGYKGGVLNEAIKLMDNRAEVISVVDSDYVVSKDFIKEGVKYLEKDVAIVQFPQDYRDFPNNFFFKGMYLSYRYFFAVIMRMCHVLDAVAFMGTVGFIRKKALLSSGGWSEEIITEDSEAGLRIILSGFKGVYVDKSVGKGIMPLDFASLKRQRFRWAYGNAQTILRHFSSLTFGKQLNLRQKIAFWIQNTVWHTPLILSVLFAFLSLIYEPIGYLGAGLLLGFIMSRTYSFLWIYRKIDKLSFYDTLLALLFYFSLFLPMSYAPIRALIPIKIPFYRTPKSKDMLESGFHYAGEIGIFLLTTLLLFTSLLSGAFVGVFISLLSLAIFLCFLTVIINSATLWYNPKPNTLSEK